MCPRLRFPGAEAKLRPERAVSGVPWRESGSMNGLGLSRRGRGGARGSLWPWGRMVPAARLCLLCMDVTDDCAGETARALGGGDASERVLAMVDPEKRDWSTLGGERGPGCCGLPMAPYDWPRRTCWSRRTRARVSSDWDGVLPPLLTTNSLFGTVRLVTDCCEYAERTDAGLEGRAVLAMAKSPVLELTEDMDELRLTVGVSRSFGVRSGNGRGTRDIMQRYNV